MKTPACMPAYIIHGEVDMQTGSSHVDKNVDLNRENLC